MVKLYELEYFRKQHKNSAYIFNDNATRLAIERKYMKKKKKKYIRYSNKCNLGTLNKKDLELINVNGELRVRGCISLWLVGKSNKK